MRPGAHTAGSATDKLGGLRMILEKTMNKLVLAVAIGTGAFLSIPTTASAQSGYRVRTVECASNHGRYHECRLPFRGQAQLVSQLSNRSCVRGRSWGQHGSTVWVNRGCRARFAMSGGNSDRGGYGDRVVDNRGGNYGYDYNNDGRMDGYYDRNGDGRLDSGYDRDSDGRLDSSYDRNGDGQMDSSYYGDGRVDSYSYGNGDGQMDGSWVRDDNYAVTCSSRDGGRSNCNWDTRYGSPRMVQQISSRECIEGRDWGYDSRGGLWVDAGCEARFGYH